MLHGQTPLPQHIPERPPGTRHRVYRRVTAGMKAWQRLLAVNPAARAPDGQAVADVIRNLR